MKKAGVRSNVSPRTFSPREERLRKQLQAKKRRAWKAGLEESCRRQFPFGKGILYWGKFDKIWGKPLGMAKWLAEGIRANPSVGWQMVEEERKLRRHEKGYLPKMMQKLGEYLEDEQPVFKPMDHAIADIVQRHPDYTIKQITSELSKQYPNQWDALEKRVQRLLKDVPWFPREQAGPDSWSDTY